MVNQWTILLLATVQLGHTSDNVTEKTLCNDKNLTLSLSRIPQLRRAIFVTSDPIPKRVRTTCTLRVNVDAAATINLTLTTVNHWKSSTSTVGAQGYEFQHESGETKFVYNNNVQVGSIAWTSASSESCPYLFVWRASATNSSDAAKLIFNESTTLNATGIIIQLRNVPETAWCAIRIAINASPMPEHYCKSKDELYCNTSVQCLNASLRCNRNQDCDNGEDEMNCSTASPLPGDYCQAKDEMYCNASVQCLSASLRCNGHPNCDNGEDENDCSTIPTTDASINQTLIYGLLGLITAIVTAATFAAICISLKQRRNRQPQALSERTYEHVQRQNAPNSLLPASRASR